jgi:cell division protein ZapA
MNESTLPITVNIFGKEYKIACGKGEREDLLTSAQQLDQQMLEIRDTGKVVGTDRIAVLAALNLAHELKTTQKQSHYTDRGLSAHLVALRQKIESVLNKS